MERRKSQRKGDKGKGIRTQRNTGKERREEEIKGTNGNKRRQRDKRKEGREERIEGTKGNKRKVFIDEERVKDGEGEAKKLRKNKEAGRKNK